MRSDRRLRRIAAGLASEPLRPMNSVRFPLTERSRFVHVGKDDAVGAVAAVGIAGKQRPALRIRFGHDVHQVGVTPFAEHQFPVPGQRQAARAPRLVAQRDHHELHRRVHGDVGEHFRGDAGLVMLEHAVAEPVPAHVAGAAARGQRRRRPERARFLVADVERLAAAVAQRVVVPRGEPEFVRVFRPGVRAAALADDRADVRAGDHVDPRRRRALAGLEGDDVLVSVGRETAQAVAEDALARRERVYRLGGWRRARAPAGPTCAPPSTRRSTCSSSGLVGVAEHDAGDGLQQDPLVLGKLFGAPHEDPARLVEHLCFGPRVDQPHDLVLQHRPVAGEILVHDHQVRRQPLHAPVRVGLQHLLDVCRCG